jgi:hypothetical protein
MAPENQISRQGGKDHGPRCGLRQNVKEKRRDDQGAKNLLIVPPLKRQALGVG